MKSSKEKKGQKELRQEVLDKGLCTNCGACVDLCPYASSYKDSLILVDQCGREEGRCYAFCPRTPTDLEGLRKSLYEPGDITAELGPFKGLYIARAADGQVRAGAQHGGTVTALISLALQEGMIETAVIAEEAGDLLPQGVVAQKDVEVKRRGKSKFVVSPTVAAFNRVAKTGVEKIGVVATPCQALSLAKMRMRPFPERDNHIEKLRLVVGLFCGWALSWRGLRKLLQEKAGGESIVGLDIPPSKYHCLEVRTGRGKVEVSLDEILPLVRPSCNYCFDMTAEFSDISVGSARLPEGWEVARGWNQVIVRTKVGEELFRAARSRGLLEVRELPEGNLERLKAASMGKKRAAVKNLAEKSGSRKDLLYLDSQDPVLRTLPI